MTKLTVKLIDGTEKTISVKEYSDVFDREGALHGVNWKYYILGNESRGGAIKIDKENHDKALKGELFKYEVKNLKGKWITLKKS